MTAEASPALISLERTQLPGPHTPSPIPAQVLLAPDRTVTVTNTPPTCPAHNTPVLWKPASGGAQPWWVLSSGKGLKSTDQEAGSPRSWFSSVVSCAK